MREPEDESSIPEASGKGVLYTWGPWHIKGILGTAINAYAVLYIVIFGFFSFWPPTAQVDAVTMNYSSLILGAVAILSGLYYAVWARRTYSGPVMEIMADDLTVVND